MSFVVEVICYTGLVKWRHWLLHVPINTFWFIFRSLWHFLFAFICSTLLEQQKMSVWVELFSDRLTFILSSHSLVCGLCAWGHLSAEAWWSAEGLPHLSPQKNTDGKPLVVSTVSVCLSFLVLIEQKTCTMSLSQVVFCCSENILNDQNRIQLK